MAHQDGPSRLGQRNQVTQFLVERHLEFGIVAGDTLAELTNK